MTDSRAIMTKIEGHSPTHKAVGHWKRQRISGAMLIPFGIWFLLEIVRHTQADYHTVLIWVAQPWIEVVLASFTSLVFFHSALGLQVVIEDYVPNSFWQMVLILKVKVLSLIMAVLSWFFIIRIAITANG